MMCGTDAPIGLVPAAEILAGVLVDLGCGEASAGAGLGSAILCAVAVGRVRDGGEIPIRVGRCVGLLGLCGTVAASAAHDQPGRRLIQTFAPFLEPFPRMP